MERCGDDPCSRGMICRNNCFQGDIVKLMHTFSLLFLQRCIAEHSKRSYSHKGQLLDKIANHTYVHICTLHWHRHHFFLIRHRISRVSRISTHISLERWTGCQKSGRMRMWHNCWMFFLWRPRGNFQPCLWCFRPKYDLVVTVTKFFVCLFVCFCGGNSYNFLVRE